jgi:hypothetical protein
MSGPVTPQFVLNVGTLFFTLTLVVLNLLLSFGLRVLQMLTKFFEIFERHVMLTREEAEILDALVSRAELPEDVKKKARGILELYDGKPQ